MVCVLLVDVNVDIKAIPVVRYVNQGHLELTVLRNVTVSTNHVIKVLVHVLLVDVNVDI